MAQLIPVIQEKEKKRITEEITGHELSLIFGGTTRSDELLAIIFRFVKEWTIQQQLVRLELLQKSINGEKMARQLLNVIARE